MSVNTFTAVRFHNYWNLLKLIKPSIEMAIIFDGTGNFIWQSQKNAHPQINNISKRVAQLLDAYEKARISHSIENIDANTTVELTVIHDEQVSKILVSAFLSSQSGESIRQEAANENESGTLLNKNLLTEYALIRTIVDKEEELNTMADELMHRYEELNLIYSSDEQVQNLSHGRELLKHIVNSAANHLEVDLAIILLPEKNIKVVQSRKTLPNDNYILIKKALRGDIYDHLKKAKVSIVLNSHRDALNRGIALDVSYKIMLSPILNADNKVIGMMAIVNQKNRIDFSNSDRNLLEVLTNKATHIVLRNFDPLTGLENKHSFEMIIKDTLKQSWQNDSYHAVANIDIDRMAVINDICGHVAGDRLIRSIGTAISKKVRAGDAVARLDSDKFGVLLKNCSLGKAQGIMQNLADGISQITVKWGQDIHEVSVSIGIAPITADLQNLSHILNNAESARLAAKEKGRNQIRVFTLDNKDLLRRKEQIQWVAKTQAALREDRLRLFAQKIEPIGNHHELPHYEILVRLKDEEGNIVEPSRFMPAAENYYLMPKLDRWVIANTFYKLHRLHKKHGGSICQVSINLSGQSLTEKNLDGFIERLLRIYSFDPRIITFEVTESAAIANFEDAKRFIKTIKKFGCRFSLDDFGTGHSSFAYLKNFDVDYLKIDGSFIQDIYKDDVLYSMVSAMNQVGHAMQLKTIAEYVENDAIMQCLQLIGVDYAQGYLITKPTPFSHVLAQLSEEQGQTRKAM